MALLSPNLKRLPCIATPLDGCVEYIGRWFEWYVYFLMGWSHPRILLTFVFPFVLRSLLFTAADAPVHFLLAYSLSCIRGQNQSGFGLGCSDRYAFFSFDFPFVRFCFPFMWTLVWIYLSSQPLTAWSRVLHQLIQLMTTSLFLDVMLVASNGGAHYQKTASSPHPNRFVSSTPSTPSSFHTVNCFFGHLIELVIRVFYMPLDSVQKSQKSRKIWYSKTETSWKQTT